MHQPVWWRVHDVIAGVLAGGGAGLVAGLFAVRALDHPAVPVALAALGAAGAVALLRSGRIGSDRFLTAGTVVAWGTVLLAGGFVAALARAISTFN